MRQFEYKIVNYERMEGYLISDLNELGAEGWKLVVCLVLTQDRTILVALQTQQVVESEVINSPKLLRLIFVRDLIVKGEDDDQ